MADFTFDGGRASGWDMDDAAEQTRVTEWLNWAGALLSLVLILGLAAWGWQLMKRDVSGVPVVRALEGPMRVTPDDPGGRLAEHQGLSVNRIAAEGTAEPPVETIVLAPAPLSLTEEDKPAAELAPQPTTPTPASAVASPPDTPAPDAEAANAADMAGKTRVIQEAETGGRTFFRLRAAGFADLDDARRFCSVLVSGDLNCIPVVQR